MVRGKAIVSVSRPIPAHQVALLDDYRARRAAGYLKAGFRRLRFSRRTYAAGSSVRVNPAVVAGSGRHSSLRETVVRVDGDSMEAMTAVFVHGVPETPVVCAACRLRWTARPETRKRARCDRSPSAIIGWQEA